MAKTERDVEKRGWNSGDGGRSNLVKRALMILVDQSFDVDSAQNKL